MPAPETIRQLVAKFGENREAYRSGKYNEAQLRQQFLDPFFEALGWDIYNRAGVSPEYQDVKIEDSLQIEGASKAPDYAFRIGKERKFYVEAKKPAVDIQYDIHPAYQLKRYAWNAHLPVSILTDFEELAVYNCKQKPNPADSAATGRDLFYKYTDYIDKWDEIAAIFSRDAVWKGSFDRYAETSKGKKGTTEVDDAILESIESWRKQLALNIALRNPQVADESQLNFAVQMTIDRILFLRICEDRGIEPEEQFKSMLEAPGIYARMVELFRRADMKYNSGLFHFTGEKGETGAADTFTPGLTIDDKVLKEIIKDIYYPCPYIFKEIPVEILGQVYEQFLGRVIRLTAGHQAKVEEKPEVRKAGGVYYTPRYIVDYIVANTVGKLLEGGTPESAAELKIVDPACGSGSFLLGAYQYLLDWHLKWYTAHEPEKWAKGKDPALVAAAGGGWKLTTAKKKEILVNNIHGVDIDAQAVEVTKLSLLLKVLEEESGQLSLGLERALPDLGRNIQCGNSLIGEDYFEGRLVVDEAERRRVNPFDWKTSFPSVFARGGFDAVIGNPPYGADLDKKIYQYLSMNFGIPIVIADSFLIFISKAIDLVKPNGFQGYIVPSTWLYMPNYKVIRKVYLQKVNFKNIILFRKPVFENAVVETCIEILQNKFGKGNEFVFTEVVDNPSLLAGQPSILHQDLLLNQEESNFLQSKNSLEIDLYNQIQEKGTKFGELADIVCGLTPYRKGKGKPPQSKNIVDNRSYDSDHKVDSTYRQYLMGRDFHRYRWEIAESRWISYGKWLAEPRFAAPFDEQEKIVIRQTADSIIAHIDKNRYLSLKNVHNVKIVDNSLTYEYLLGLLNSKVMTWWYRELIPEKGRVFAEVKVVNLEKLPIHTIDFSKPTEVKQHDRMVALVDRMLELHKKTPATPQEQERLTRDIESTDREIDKLVYELYGLTEEEIQIVEGG